MKIRSKELEAKNEISKNISELQRTINKTFLSTTGSNRSSDTVELELAKELNDAANSEKSAESRKKRVDELKALVKSGKYWESVDINAVAESIAQEISMEVSSMKKFANGDE